MVLAVRHESFDSEAALGIGFRLTATGPYLDLHALLRSLRDLFLDFGGHKKAAGFSMEKANLDIFLEKLHRYIDEHEADMIDECSPVDHEAETFLRRADVNMLRILLPFGEGNPAPLLSDGATLYTVDNALNVIDG